MTLDELAMNKIGKISSLNCSGDLRRRFLDLGIIANTSIVPILKSPFGETKAYRIRGTTIALRKEDSALILINE